MEYNLIASRSGITIATFSTKKEAQDVLDLIQNTAIDGTVLKIVEVSEYWIRSKVHE